tara:strand:- start:1 stop:375 length:375 start_codon:yes stop_codon:yes gene_type:complete
MESRRLHEEFSNLSRHQNGPANINAKACVSNSLINLATYEMHGDAMSGGLETTLNLQTDSTGHIQLLPVLSIKILVLMQSFNEFLSVVILRRGAGQNALNSAHGEHQAFHSREFGGQSIDKVIA